VVRSPLRHRLLFLVKTYRANTLRARKRGRTLPVPNPSVTLGLATGGTISIVTPKV
jgi:hypothetical protein